MNKNLFYALCIFLMTIADLRAAPQFTNTAWRGTSIVLSGANGGTNPDYELLTSTNPALPFVNWTVSSTNSFSSNGSFVLTNPVGQNAKQQFFALHELPAQNDLWVPTCGSWMGAYESGGSAASNSLVESQIGRNFDIYRFYDGIYSGAVNDFNWTNLTPTELNYITNGSRVLISFRPGTNWANAGGGNSEVNADITWLAKSVTKVKPNKIMMCVWAEPEGDVSINGTTNDYVAMWQNVRGIFDSNGATNVIWIWIIENYPPLHNLLPGLWPGNAYVDWVGYDVYQSSASENYIAKQTAAYDWLTTNSTATCSWTNKPWAWTEWGIGLNGWYPTAAEETNTINAVNAAINQTNLWPRVKMMAFFDDDESVLLPGTMPCFNNYANSPYMKQECSP